MLQREYYQKTAAAYDDMHGGDAEHMFALALLGSLIEFLQIRSVLDIGAGTGRAWKALKSTHPDIQVVGIEPVAGLRAIGHAKGIPPDELMDGDVMSLPFPKNSFDLVCSFGVLHHVS